MPTQGPEDDPVGGIITIMLILVVFTIGLKFII